jgi:hypothetical protein
MLARRETGRLPVLKTVERAKAAEPRSLLWYEFGLVLPATMAAHNCPVLSAPLQNFVFPSAGAVSLWSPG